VGSIVTDCHGGRVLIAGQAFDTEISQEVVTSGPLGVGTYEAIADILVGSTVETLIESFNKFPVGGARLSDQQYVLKRRSTMYGSYFCSAALLCGLEARLHLQLVRMINWNLLRRSCARAWTRIHSRWINSPAGYALFAQSSWHEIHLRIV
jgi:hypothetical protein